VGRARLRTCEISASLLPPRVQEPRRRDAYVCLLGLHCGCRAAGNRRRAPFMGFVWHSRLSNHRPQGLGTRPPRRRIRVEHSRRRRSDRFGRSCTWSRSRRSQQVQRRRRWGHTSRGSEYCPYRASWTPPRTARPIQLTRDSSPQTLGSTEYFHTRVLRISGRHAPGRSRLW